MTKIYALSSAVYSYNIFMIIAFRDSKLTHFRAFTSIGSVYLKKYVELYEYVDV